MVIRDPLGELWAARPRGRSSSSLTVPYKHPATGSIVWLSVGQWMTLLFLRRGMKHGRGETTLARIGAATDAWPGTVTHRLDRLASLGLVGRHSRVGRGHRTRYWPARAGARSWRPAGGNVAPSTAYGGLIRGYATRGGVRRAWRGRSAAPPDPPAGGTAAGRRRSRPPRLVWERCPRDGGQARLTAWRWSLSSARLVAVWDGICPRCGAVVVAPLVVDLEADRWAMRTAGDVLADVTALTFTRDGRRHPRAAAPAIPPGPRLDRLRELAIDAIASGELDQDQVADLGARWLGWRPVRIPEPVVVAGDVVELDALRSTAWSSARDWRPVRYSQRPDDVDDPPLSVRDSQPAGDVDDGRA